MRTFLGCVFLRYQHSRSTGCTTYIVSLGTHKKTGILQIINIVFMVWSEVLRCIRLDIRDARSCVSISIIRRLSQIFHDAKDGKSKEKELYGITYGGHKATASQIHTTLYPKPTRRHRVSPTDNANHKTEDCTQHTYNK